MRLLWLFRKCFICLTMRPIGQHKQGRRPLLAFNLSPQKQWMSIKLKEHGVILRNFIRNRSYLGWKRPSGSSNPSINLTYRVPSLNHVPQQHKEHQESEFVKNWKLRNELRKHLHSRYKPPLSVFKCQTSCCSAWSFLFIGCSLLSRRTLETFDLQSDKHLYSQFFELQKIAHATGCSQC